MLDPDSLKTPSAEVERAALAELSAATSLATV